MKIKTICLSFLTSVLLTVIALLLIALWMYRSGPSDGAVNIAILAVYVLSNFAGGFLLGKCAGKKRYLWGLGLGNAYFLCLLLLSLVIGNGGTLGVIHGALTYGLIVVSASFGGMLAG